MKQTHRPFAAKLRRLHSLERQVKSLAVSELSGRKRNELIRRFRTLLRTLRSALHTRWWLKPAICIALYLQISLTEVTGQQFAPPLVNPFGIQNVDQGSFYKAVDIDNDGDEDIIGIGYDYNQYLWRISYYENVGNASNNIFAPPTEGAFGLNLNSLTEGTCFFDFGDLDGDGDFDMMANVGYEYNYADTVYNQIFAYFENTGTQESAQFVAPQLFTISSEQNVSIGLMSFADIDNDGDLDVFSNAFTYGYQYDPYLYIHGFKTVYYENSGTPENFDFATGALHPFDIYGLEDERFLLQDFGDLDGDGDLDLLTNIFDEYAELGNFIYQENIGSKTSPAFGDVQENPFQLPADSPIAHIPQLVDLDHDGDLDLLTTGYDYNTYEISIYYFENTDISAVHDLSDLGINLELSPNPVKDVLCVDIEHPESISGQLLLRITDIRGHALYHQNVDSPKVEIGLQDLPPGTYQLELSHAKGHLTKQFIKLE